jgi:hypothetical protein
LETLLKGPIGADLDSKMKEMFLYGKEISPFEILIEFSYGKDCGLMNA